MLPWLLRHEHRHLLHRRTPWLFFGRDHPLREETSRINKLKHCKDPDDDYRDYEDMEAEWGWLLDLPEE